MHLDEARQRKITGIELLQFDDTDGCGRSGVLRVSSRGTSGYAQCALPDRAQPFDIVRWGAFLLELRHPAVGDALALADAKRRCWGEAKAELVHAALTDLERRLGGASDRSCPELPLERCQAYLWLW